MYSYHNFINMKLFRFSFMAVAASAMVMLSACGNSQKAAASEDAAAEETTETLAEDQPALSVQAGVVNELEAGGTIRRADRPVIIDFSATWCGPCQQFKPIFHDAAAEYANDYYFYSVDVDNCPEMAQAYSVQSIPQVSVLYPDGTIYNHQPGFMDADQFKAFLESVKNQ